jgi:predicted transcriptional regulator
MKPNASLHNPHPTYLRGLISRAGLTQQGAARRLGISSRMMRYYLTPEDADGHRPAPYVVQYALEQLAH